MILSENVFSVDAKERATVRSRHMRRHACLATTHPVAYKEQAGKQACSDTRVRWDRRRRREFFVRNKAQRQQSLTPHDCFTSGRTNNVYVFRVQSKRDKEKGVQRFTQYFLTTALDRGKAKPPGQRLYVPQQRPTWHGAT